MKGLDDAEARRCGGKGVTECRSGAAAAGLQQQAENSEGISGCRVQWLRRERPAAEEPRDDNPLQSHLRSPLTLKQEFFNWDGGSGADTRSLHYNTSRTDDPGRLPLSATEAQRCPHNSNREKPRHLRTRPGVMVAVSITEASLP